MRQQIECKICKNLFTPKSIKEIICSDVCRLTYKRYYSYNLYEKIKKAKNKKKGLIKCKQCGKEFYQAYKKVFCSSMCRINYKPPVKPKKPKKYDLPHTWKVNHPYRMYKVEPKFDSELQKIIEKQELDNAVNKYLDNGGEIKKLEELPAPSLPSVGSREWEWDVRVGLGFVGPDSVADQDYIDIEMLEYLVSKR